MATFAKSSFNAVSYAAYRPTYPRALYDFVYAYHEKRLGTVSSSAAAAARWDVALDLGCGTGQAATALTRFDRVIGIDPSESMIQKARAATTGTMTATANASSIPRISFLKHTAEDLDFLDDASIDLIISAQAAHWFDYTRLWPQLARVLKRNGTVAFWGYSQFRLTSYPSLTPLIHAYCQGTSLTDSVGPYWEQPGRNILDRHFLDVPNAPAEFFGQHERVYWTGTHYPTLPNPRPVLLQKRMPWAALQAYFRTFSSLHTYNEHNPEDSLKRTGLDRRPAKSEYNGMSDSDSDLQDKGDVVERFWWKLKEEVARERAARGVGGDEGDGDGGEEEEVDVEWPMAMMLYKRV